MIKLPQIALISINCVDPNEAAKAMVYSMRGIEFGQAILFTSEPVVSSDPRITVKKIKKLNWHEYNDACLSIGRAFRSDYALFIQDDGFVINPDNWDPKFLEYDYIGAPWPSDPQWADQQVARAEIHRVFPYNRVGNGGFSLRSRKFMELSDHFHSCGLYGEDCYLCTIHYDYMIKHGIKFAPFELALKFSYENQLPEMEYPNKLNPALHFGFHGRQLNNSNDIINLKNIY